MQVAKRAYVGAIRAIGSVARCTGLLGYLEKNRASRASLYLRSLFSIYDAEDLARLDLPWWAFGAIDHVDAILRRRGRDMVAFEYGSGASTVWLARRCRAVYSVEHESEWAERTRALCAPHGNVEILAVAPMELGATTRCRSGRTGWEKYSFDDYVESIRRFPFHSTSSLLTGVAVRSVWKRRAASSRTAGLSSSTTAIGGATVRPPIGFLSIEPYFEAWCLGCPSQGRLRFSTT